MSQINPYHKKKRVGVSRAHCDDLISTLIQRASSVNEGSEFAFIVERVTVFGSYLTDKERLGDLDVVVELKRRFADQALQEDAEKKRIGARRTRPRDIADQIFWPQNEVNRFLKRRSTAFSFHEALGAPSPC